MTACPTLSYAGVTADAWAAIRARVEAEIGITIAARGAPNTASIAQCRCRDR